MQLILIPGWLAVALRAAHQPMTSVLKLGEDYGQDADNRHLGLTLTDQDIEWYGYFNQVLDQVLPKGLVEGFDYGTRTVLRFDNAAYEQLTSQSKRCQRESKTWGIKEYHQAIQTFTEAQPVETPTESVFQYTAMQPVWLDDSCLGLMVINQQTQTLRSLVNSVLYHLYTRSRLADLAKTPLFTYFFQLES